LYELWGRKIIVFKDMALVELQSMSWIDPHFSEDSKVFVRFSPTKAGWDAA